MSQYVDNHPLGKDFPEMRDAIHQMKTNNSHFSKLFDEYEAIDREVVRAEQGVDHVSDLMLEEMKMKRVHLKDELYGMLVAHQQQQ
ncbi:MAG: YdcH family protein [Burkholderiaceae bacterium]|nr:YdcH family protein [Burkholderiaceae bacterium]